MLVFPLFEVLHQHGAPARKNALLSLITQARKSGDCNHCSDSTYFLHVPTRGIPNETKVAHHKQPEKQVESAPSLE
jgi:hypothetical protein